MAEARSIVNIDVNSESFKAFQAAFDRYKKVLATTPDDWAKIGAAAAKAGKMGQKSIELEAEAIASMTVALSAAVRQQGELNRGTERSSKLLKDVSRTTKSIATDLASGTWHLLKWAALGGIVGVATGGFGIGPAAQRGSNLRNQSFGLGSSPGQILAGQSVYGPMGVDTQSLMQNILNAQTDPAKRAALAVLGFRGADLKRPPGELMPDVIQRVVQDMRSHGANQARYRALHMDELLDFPSAYGLSRRSDKELADAAKEYGEQSKALNVQDPTLKAAQDLEKSFHEASNEIRNSFLVALAPAAPLITAFSHSVADAFQKLGGASVELAKDPQHILETGALTTRFGESIGGWLSDIKDDWQAGDKKFMSDRAYQNKYGMPKTGLPADFFAPMGTMPAANSNDYPDMSISETRRQMAHMTDRQMQDASDAMERRIKAKQPPPASFGLTSVRDARVLYSVMSDSRLGPGTNPSPTVRVDVNNQTGGDTNVIANQLVH